MSKIVLNQVGGFLVNSIGRCVTSIYASNVYLFCSVFIYVKVRFHLFYNVFMCVKVLCRLFYSAFVCEGAPSPVTQFSSV